MKALYLFNSLDKYLSISFKNYSICFLILFNLIISKNTFGASISWTGGTSTNWTTNSNWSGGSKPTSTDDVTIPSGTTYSPKISEGTSGNCRNLTINSGATLTLDHTSIGSLNIYGNVNMNGTLNHTGTIYIYLYGSGKTFGGSGNFFSGVASPFSFESGSSYTLQNNINIRHMYISSGGSFDVNGYTITTEFFFQVGTFYLRAGLLNIWGNPDASMWANPGDAINPYFSTDGNFVPGTGTVFYCQGDTYSANNQTVRSTTYYNLKIRTQNTKTTTIGTSGTITVSNDLTIINTSTAGGIASTAVTTTVGNNFYLGNTGNALTLNLANRIYRASGTGTFTMGNISGHAINNTYASASNYVISGFDAVPTFYGTFTYNSGSAQKVIPATYNNLVSTGTGTKTMYGDVTVSGYISFTNGNYVQGTYNMNVAGNWTSTGNYYSEGTGNVTFNGSSTSTITASSAIYGGTIGTSLLTESFENAGSIPSGWGTDIIGATTTVAALSYLTSNTNPSVSPSAGSYLVKFNSYIAASGNQARLKRTSSFSTTGYSNIVVNFDWYKDNAYSTSNDYVTIQYSTNGSTWTTTGSNITRYSASNGWTTQSVTLPVGAENQSILYIAFLFTSQYGNNCSLDNVSITGDIAGTTYAGEGFNKVIVNKTSGGVTLASKILIQTSMTMTNGIMTSTSSFYPEFDEDATTSGASASSHVNGYVLKRTNTTTKFTFPVGDGTKYRLASITPSSTSSTTWTCKYFSSAYSDLSLLNITSVSNVEYWTIDRSGSANSTVELSWDASSNITSLTNLVVAHYNGADWESAGNSASSGTTSAGLVSSTAAWSAYSPFTLSVNTPVSLPIELVYFQAKSEQNDVKLNWETAVEINNDYFTIERSFDGIHFSPITRMDGAGNSTHKIDYLTIDKDYINGINYYRLIQTDYNGEETTSKIVSVDMTKKNNQFMNTVNSIGQEVDKNYSGIVFDVYSDGTTIKRIQ